MRSSLNLLIYVECTRVVCAAQNDGDEVEPAEDGEELLRGVVPAEGVLEGQVELVLALRHPVTLHTLLLKVQKGI